ncbi:GNAT family N-acetyltransferase [Dictyobacter kobayashii]|uniref:N-acetyltransferase domain-containing protein n=1 Tax=Dictyobacter kobayashii TaxID=2014872 RepID=A0A402AMV4_9CHLR|nr:GNAT family N-acetyltransferase [Dictyobacter kobayashii]GCE20473.1 hypothetical protein KDK_42730 [Dictyobacter kobayashii]
MDHIEVRAVHVSDAPALHELDFDFETDRIYTLQVHNHLIHNHTNSGEGGGTAFAFELVETAVDPPFYKNFHGSENSLGKIKTLLQTTEGGFVALVDGNVVGGIFLMVEDNRSVVRIQNMIVARQFQRYGVGSLLLSCAADWARKQKCWAIVLETQNTNYPAIQFYLRNGLEIWSINRHFYPPGELSHEVAIFMGKRLSSTSES